MSEEPGIAPDGVILRLWESLFEDPEHPHSSGLAAGIGAGRPHPARIYDHWLGGKDALAIDREVAGKVAEVAPWVVAGARGNRAFLMRAVRELAEAGIDQFLDIGAGLPTAGNVHEMAQRVNPSARVVYVDHDPVVLAHARALLAEDERTVAVAGDLRDPEAILADPAVRRHLDFSRPIGVFLVAVLHFVEDREDPVGIVATIREAVAPGSHLVLSHVSDLHDDPKAARRVGPTRAAAQMYRELAAPFVLRTRDDLARILEGWELLPPGIVPAQLWRPGRRVGHSIMVLAAVGRRGGAR